MTAGSTSFHGNAVARGGREMHQGHVPARLMAMRIASDDDDNDDTNTGPLRKGEMNTVFACVTVFRRSSFGHCSSQVPSGDLPRCYISVWTLEHSGSYMLAVWLEPRFDANRGFAALPVKPNRPIWVSCNRPCHGCSLYRPHCGVCPILLMR